ncbi:hypothetical protein WSS_A15204 [Rhodococcus opacus M213]|uniref:Uncharacterized protein n=1 Tax=Rhodococcus opacus M213 TaxID=1129896 RepID=K8XLY7_RHOOP|nr:hypothetical protein [Rhodococcus opacus]EKT81851.1 hypothetical protein WSS_A15204 [Rhodococcus opacus M213]
MDYPRIATDDRRHAVTPLSHKDANKVYSKVDKWREENPNAFYQYVVEETGGCMIQFWGYRIYYGRCVDCSGVVTRRRKISPNKTGPTWTGRWPLYCTECTAKKSAKRVDANRARVRARRAAEYAERDAQREKAGLPPITQGYRSDLR